MFSLSSALLMIMTVGVVLNRLIIMIRHNYLIIMRNLASRDEINLLRRLRLTFTASVLCNHCSAQAAVYRETTAAYVRDTVEMNP